MAELWVNQIPSTGIPPDFSGGASGTVGESAVLFNLGTYNYNLQEDLTAHTIVGWRYDFEVTAGVGQIELVHASDGVGPGTSVVDSVIIPISGPGVYSWTPDTVAPDLVERLAMVDFPHGYGFIEAASGGPFNLAFFRFIAITADDVIPPALPGLIPPRRVWPRDDDLTHGGRRLYPPPTSLQASPRRAGGYL